MTCSALTKRLSCILSGLVFLSVPSIAAQAQTDQEPIELEAPVEVFKEAPPSLNEDLPQSFKLSGYVYEISGDTVAKARIAVNGRRIATTNRDGHFALSKTLHPDDLISVSHSDYITVTKPAGEIYIGDNIEVRIETVAFSESFNLTRAGGTYTSGEITLQVPEGAVSRSTKVRAAILPMDFAYEDSRDLQMQRMATIEFAPAGLKFKKPITVTMPLAYSTGAVTGEVLLLDRETGRYEQDTDAALQVSGDRITMFLSHFSRRSAGDPAQGVTSGKIESLSSDLNGDGALTSEDAEFIIALIGGTHIAEVSHTRIGESAVMQTTESGSSTGSSGSTTVSGGISFGGIGVDVSSTLSRNAARDILERTGLESRQTQESTTGFSVSVGEVKTRCKEVFGIYDFHEVETWVRHKFSETEMESVRRGFESRQDPDDPLGYFDWNKPTAMAIGRTAFGPISYAVRERNGVLETYIRTGRYVVRKYRGNKVEDCNTETWQQQVAKTLGGGTGGGAMQAMDDNYHPWFGGNADTGYGGWGILPDSEPEFYLNRECGVNATGSVTISSRRSVTIEAEESRSESGGSETTESGSASISLPGGISVTAGAGQTRGSDWSNTSTKSHGRNLVSGSFTTVSWEIVNAHEIHYSDHMVAKLYNVVVRGDPPTIIKRPIGIAIIRFATRPCGDDGDTPGEPGDDSSGSPDDTGPGAGGTPGATSPADPRPPVTTPGPGEYHPPGEQGKPETEEDGEGDRDEASAPRRAPEPVRVSFTSLDGETQVNSDMVGDIETIVITAVDDTNVPVDGEKVTVEERYGGIRVSVDDAIQVGSILIRGKDGIVLLEADRTPPKGPPGLTWPKDGAVDIKNGRLNETFSVPESIGQVNAPPSDYRITVGDSPADCVAVRSNEIAVVAQDLPPSTVQGSSMDIEIEAPDGATTEGEVPAWSWRLSAQPVTALNTWAPIFFQCSGLPASEQISIRFLPQPWQKIEPLEVNLTCGQASSLTVIAQYMTSQLGVQSLSSVVTRASQ